jgi:urease accessory protein
MIAVALSEVGRRGRLNLQIGVQHGRTVIRDAYCEIPFKITRLHDSHSSGISHLILMQSTAGLFGGDTTECTIHVESGARILITQQSATKVHPSGGRRAIQTNRIRVESGGELHLYYEPLIPFCGARAFQTTSIDVEPGARLYFWESLMAGRVGRGEIWQFEEFSSETSLRVNGRPLFLDRFHLIPKQVPPSAEWMMGGARYLATGLCFDDRAADLAENVRGLLPDAGLGMDTPEPGLAVARLVTVDGPEFHRYRSVFTAVCQRAFI